MPDRVLPGYRHVRGWRRHSTARCRKASSDIEKNSLLSSGTAPPADPTITADSLPGDPVVVPEPDSAHSQRVFPAVAVTEKHRCRLPALVTRAIPALAHEFPPEPWRPLNEAPVSTRSSGPPV